MKTITDATLRREVSENMRRLFRYRELFGDAFVGRQCVVCLQLLGGLAAAF